MHVSLQLTAVLLRSREKRACNLLENKEKAIREGTYYNHSKAKYSMRSLLLEHQSPEVNRYILGDSQSL